MNRNVHQILTAARSRRIRPQLEVFAWAGFFLFFAAPVTATAGSKPQTLFNFVQNGYPKGSLLLGPNGQIFGVDSGILSGAPDQRGAIFELLPPAPGHKLWSRVVLHKFKSLENGFNPQVGVVADPAGNLYGTAYGGVVFRLSPPPPGQTKWSYTVLADTPAGLPDGQLFISSNGTLFGTLADISVSGGCNCGIVFSITPPIKGHEWSYSLIYAFLGGADGENPESGLLTDAAGNLYGTTTQGGPANAGTVFELMPPASGQTNWTEKQLYAFQGGADGESPMGNLAWGKNGIIYGTTDGTIFQLAPPANGQGAWVETVLAGGLGLYGQFMAGVVVGSDGTLYGTSPEGGHHGGGAVFAVYPPANGSETWTFQSIYDFGVKGRDPFYPAGGVVIGQNNIIYGTTEYGGSGSGGTVFSISQ